MIEAAVILILMLAMLFPMPLVLVPMLGGNGTTYEYAESYQGHR
jgi:hypothetical protein